MYCAHDVNFKKIVDASQREGPLRGNGFCGEKTSIDWTVGIIDPQLLALLDFCYRLV